MYTCHDFFFSAKLTKTDTQTAVHAHHKLENKRVRVNICCYTFQSIPKHLYAQARHISSCVGTLHVFKLNKLAIKLPRQTTKVNIGTNYNLLTQPLVMLDNVGTILVYVTQPQISTIISTSSVIRVFLRYRAIKAISALKSPKLQEIRSNFKAGCNYHHFHSYFGKHSFTLKLLTRRTFPPPVTQKTELGMICLLYTSDAADE